MKRYVLSMVAGGAALAVASSASAQTVVRITGSTAFRKFVHQGIVNILGGNTATTFSYGYQGTDPTKASQSEWVGTTTNGISVDIKCSWGGSVSGLIATINTNPVGNVTHYWPAFTNMAANVSYGSSPTGGRGNLGVNATTLAADVPGQDGPWEAPRQGDVAMSDSFEGTAGFSGLSPVLGNGKVGVVVFAFARGADCPTSVTNITTLLARDLLTNGQVPLSQFTGVAGDSATTLICVGRDADSGTRVVELSESGFGVFNAPTQYQINSSAGAVTSINLYPDETINGILYANGSGGYASGGNVATALSATGSAAVNVPGIGTGCYLVGFFGGTDIGSVSGAGGGDAATLLWNGVAYDEPAGTSVIEGKYTYWSYELMYRRPTLATGAGSPTAIAQLIAGDIQNVPTQKGLVKLTDMKVSRTIEGGIVTR